MKLIKLTYYTIQNPKLFSSINQVTAMTLIIIDPCIFENIRKIVFSRLLSFCDFHNIISNSQFGFRKGLSTLHAIENIHKAIIDSLISNKYCVSLFIYLKQAFDHSKP